MQHARHNRTLPIGMVVIASLAISLPLLALIGFFWHEWATFALAWPMAGRILQLILFGGLAAAPVVGLALVAMRWIRPRYIDAYHVEQLILAQRSQGLPAHVQSLSFHDSHKDVPALPAPDQPMLPAPNATPPSLSDAIARGWSTPERWLIGVSQAAKPLQITLEHTGFIALSGVQGTGKTNEAALLAAQCARHGGTVFCADPQAGDKQSLANRVSGLDNLAGIASTPDVINAMVAKVDSIYTFRNQNPGNYPPLLLLLDEFLDMMIRKELSDQAIATLIALSSTGRKKNMFAALCSTNWNMRALGGPGVAIRQNVTAALVFNSSIETAGLLLPSAYAQQVLLLKPGQCLYFVRGSEPEVAITPELTAADLGYSRPMLPTAPVSPAVASSVAPQSTLAPTTRVQAPPTTQLPSTIPDQILLLLDGRGGYMTASEIAAMLGMDLQVVRVVIGDMYKAGQLARRECQGRTTKERYEYNKFKNKYTSGKLTASA